MWRIPSLRWKSTDNVPVVVVALTLEEGRFEVDVVERKMAAGSQLTGEAEAGTTGCWTIRLLVVLLAILKALQNPTSLALVESPVLLPLDCQDPTALNEVFRLYLP